MEGNIRNKRASIHIFLDSKQIFFVWLFFLRHFLWFGQSYFWTIKISDNIINYYYFYSFILSELIYDYWCLLHRKNTKISYYFKYWFKVWFHYLLIYVFFCKFRLKFKKRNRKVEKLYLFSFAVVAHILVKIYFKKRFRKITKLTLMAFIEGKPSFNGAIKTSPVKFNYYFSLSGLVNDKTFYIFVSWMFPFLFSVFKLLTRIVTWMSVFECPISY